MKEKQTAKTRKPMTSRECSIQVVCADPGLTRKYLSELESVGEPCHVLAALSPAEARQNFRSAERAVVLLDESAAPAAALKGSLESTVALLTLLMEAAPVVVVAAPDRQSELTLPITSGAVDFVSRSGDFVPIAAGLVKRRIRIAASSEDLTDDFGEILRHELNNPLTGILGNAEMLLARRDHLPACAIERLETIAELAVRLRETVRRLSNASGAQNEDVGSIQH